MYRDRFYRIIVQCADGSCQIFLLLRRETDNDYLIEKLVVFFKGYINPPPAVYTNSHGVISERGEFQYGIRRDGQAVCPILIRCGSDRRRTVLNHYSHAGKGLPVQVRHRTGDRVLGQSCSNCT